MKRAVLWILPPLLLAAAAVASNVVLPHTFSANTPAVAAEVNADFDALVTGVNDNFARLTRLEAGLPVARTTAELQALLQEANAGQVGRLAIVLAPATFDVAGVDFSMVPNLSLHGTGGTILQDVGFSSGNVTFDDMVLEGITASALTCTAAYATLHHVELYKNGTPAEDVAVASLADCTLTAIDSRFAITGGLSSAAIDAVASHVNLSNCDVSVDDAATIAVGVRGVNLNGLDVRSSNINLRAATGTAVVLSDLPSWSCTGTGCRHDIRNSHIIAESGQAITYGASYGSLAIIHSGIEGAVVHSPAIGTGSYQCFGNYVLTSMAALTCP